MCVPRLAFAQADAPSSEERACLEALNGERSTAGRLCEEAARGGSRRAMYYLGHMYREGHLVGQDFNMAVYWLEQAVRAGVILAGPALRMTQDEGPKGMPRPGAVPFLSAERANIIMGLFVNGCAAHFSSPVALGEWIDERGYPPLAQESAAYFLGGQEGVGWSASNQAGEFVVTFTGADRSCTVWARRADAATIDKRFRAMISSLEKQRFRIEKVSTAAGQPADTSKSQLAYYVQAPATDTAAVYVMVASRNEDAPFAVQLTAAPVAVKPVTP